MIREKEYTFRVHRRDGQGEPPLVTGAGAWAAILDRHLARRLAEEQALQAQSEERKRGAE